LNYGIEQSAFLLHSRPYRESQLLVDLLTEHDGKVGAVVYSGKTAKSNKKSLLQPFQPLRISLKGRSNLKRLSLVESAGKSIPLSGNFLFSGFYVNELLVKLLPELIPCDELFKQYQLTLQQLDLQQGIEPILRQLELMLLEDLGVALDYSPAYVDDGLPYVYFCAQQGLVATACGQGNYPKAHIQQIAEQSYQSPEVLQTFKRLMRQIIEHLLGHKPLNSRKLFIK